MNLDTPPVKAENLCDSASFFLFSSWSRISSSNFLWFSLLLKSLGRYFIDRENHVHRKNVESLHEQSLSGIRVTQSRNNQTTLLLRKSTNFGQLYLKTMLRSMELTKWNKNHRLLKIPFKLDGLTIQIINLLSSVSAAYKNILNKDFLIS